MLKKIKKIPARPARRPKTGTTEYMNEVIAKMQAHANHLMQHTRKQRPDIVRELCLFGIRAGLEPDVANNISKKITGYIKD